MIGPTYDDGSPVMTPGLREALPREAGGTQWTALCAELGIDPLAATADEVLGGFPDGMWDANGDRVFLAGDAIDDLPEDVYGPHKTSDADLAAVARLDGVGLTNAEWEVLEGVADIGTTYGYAKRVGERLGMPSASVRMHLARARAKILREFEDAALGVAA